MINKEKGWEKRVPIVRVQSESILDRFPLKHTNFKDTYRKSITRIIKNGYGVIIMISQDGLGHGFGNLILNRSI